MRRTLECSDNSPGRHTKIWAFSLRTRELRKTLIKGTPLPVRDTQLPARDTQLSVGREGKCLNVLVCLNCQFGPLEQYTA